MSICSIPKAVYGIPITNDDDHFLIIAKKIFITIDYHFSEEDIKYLFKNGVRQKQGSPSFLLNYFGKKKDTYPNTNSYLILQDDISCDQAFKINYMESDERMVILSGIKIFNPIHKFFYKEDKRIAIYDPTYFTPMIVVSAIIDSSIESETNNDDDAFFASLFHWKKKLIHEKRLHKDAKLQLKLID